MSSIHTFIKKYALASYYILTFTLSWGGVLLVVGGPVGFLASGPQVQSRLPAVVLSLVSGPIVSGILMTALVGGRAALRDFLSRLLRWRVSARWYAVAILTSPLAVLAALLVLSPVSPSYQPGIAAAPDKVTILLSGLMAGLAGGLFEEPGWTGFATPRLRSRYGIFAAGLVAGLLWGLWHFIVALWASGTPDGAFVPVSFFSQVTFYVGVLPAYRVLMVWVYDRTESLLVAMLMHGSLTAVTTYILAPSVTDDQRLVYHAVLSVVVWIVVAAVAVANRGRLSQPLSHSQTARQESTLYG